jgi:hypothetical protein
VNDLPGRIIVDGQQLTLEEHVRSRGFFDQRNNTLQPIENASLNTLNQIVSAARLRRIPNSTNARTEIATYGGNFFYGSTNFENFSNQSRDVTMLQAPYNGPPLLPTEVPTPPNIQRYPAFSDAVVNIVQTQYTFVDRMTVGTPTYRVYGRYFGLSDANVPREIGLNADYNPNPGSGQGARVFVPVAFFDLPIYFRVQDGSTSSPFDVASIGSAVNTNILALNTDINTLGTQNGHYANFVFIGDINDPTKGPTVMVIDAISKINDGGINAGDRFFAIAGNGVLATQANTELPQSVGAVLRYAVSDGINPRAGFSSGQSVEENFHRPGGSSIAGFTQFNGLRPEDTYVAGAARGDTHLLAVAGDPTSRNSLAPDGIPTAVMRVDLQVAADGQSSASVSVGGIAPLTVGVDALPQSARNDSLALSGSTVGSSRLRLSAGGAPDPSAPIGGSLVINSGFGSLATDATATGAHLFAGSTFPGATAVASDAERQAWIGYFAVGEADPRLGVPDQGPDQPGLVAVAVPNATNLEFGFTRLASGVGEVTGAREGTPVRMDAQGVPERDQRGRVVRDPFQGFASGLVEQVVVGPGGPSGTVQALASRNLGDVQITFAPDRTELERTVMNVALGEVGRIVGAAQRDVSLAFGGRDRQTDMPLSAYANDTTIAALGYTPGARQDARPGIAMASVNDDVARALPSIAVPGDIDANGQQRLRPFPVSNEHVQWGFFLGDVTNSSSQREHVGMGFWVAGRAVRPEHLDTVRGTATYTGGMIGNVVDQNGIRTAVGGFSHTFDFGDRANTRGRNQFSANFDGARWSNGSAVGTSMPANGNVFSGAGATTSGATRTLAVQGAFFHNNPTPGTIPAATGGQFGVTGTNYGANGIFVGRKQ